MEKVEFRIGSFSATDEWVDGMHYLKIYRDGSSMPVSTIPATGISPESILSDFKGWLNGDRNIVSDLLSLVPGRLYSTIDGSDTDMLLSINTIVSMIADYRAAYPDHAVGGITYNDDGHSMKVVDMYLDKVLLWIEGWDSDMYAAVYAATDGWWDVE